MLKYFINRLGISIVTLAIVITSVFFLVRLAPGGPFDGERRLPVEIEKNLKAALTKSGNESLKDRLMNDVEFMNYQDAVQSAMK